MKLSTSHSSCAVLEKRYTEQHISDDNDRSILLLVLIIWWSIILKKSFRSRTDNYKIIEKQKICIRYNHVLYPDVPIKDLKLRMEDYQWLSEIGLTMTGCHWKEIWKTVSYYKFNWQHVNQMIISNSYNFIYFF